MTIVEAAVSQLSQINSLQGIRDLAASLSASATKSGGVLYSGWIDGVYSGDVAKQVAAGLNASIIDDTPRAAFLTNPAVSQRIADIIGTLEPHLLPDQVAFKVGDFLNGKTSSTLASSLWGEASRDFVRSLSGEAGSPDGAKRNPGTAGPHSAVLHAGYASLSGPDARPVGA